ncbi:flagellar hook-length control protein FliK [Saccharibacillus sp. CPCC 101409]|uniref:flagellar hook-length control protein FliK n=1 Tax=Saccharibacillus sp. CPCC 101409 TaxID=3058041 RepID=UPI002673A300|nr:flagellar hook-length control protein FliK [Saccharibacillus sp. CPCC 101409]MDO3410698.1 flagellar hook-length control protein FliK [Saccharibacillus sp. CPCC 101409]
MGMVIQGMMASGAAPAGKGAVVAAGGATAIFGQSLQQLMGAAPAVQTEGEAGAASVPANPLLSALQQLVAAAEQTTDDSAAPAETEQLDAKLDELLKQFDSLDDALAENPQLASMLQSWIQQAQALLSGGSAQEDGGEAAGQEQTAETPAIEALASNPATLKFALQDTVSQLIQLQKSADTGSGMKVQAQQMLMALEQTTEEGVQQTGVQTSSVVKQNTEQNPALIVQTQQDEKGTVKGETASARGAATAQSETAAGSSIAAAKTAESGGKQSGSDTNRDGDRASDPVPDDIRPQPIVTAGELALRAGSAAPAKAAEAVPVHKFAQEVQNLVVDKLEILQKQGFTEAKISLTPDHLGKVDIRITMHGGQLVAQFVTEHAAAKDMLEQQMSQLRGTLQGQGLTVEKLEVSQNSQLQSQMFQNGGQAGSGQQQGKRSRAREESNDDALLTAELGEELSQWIRQKAAAQSGSSFIAEA